MIAFPILKRVMNTRPDGDAEFSRGKMFVGSDGIQVVLNGCSGVLSGNVPWDMAPKYLAMLRVASESDYAPEIHDRVSKMIAKAGVVFDDVELFIGAYGFEEMVTDYDPDVSSLLGTIMGSWHLIERCPWASLHNELERVRLMSKDDLIEYTEPILG